jgi:hypothetical protein
MSKTTSFTKVAESAANLAAGAQKHLATVTSVTLLGTSYTPAQLEAELNSLSSLRSAVDAAQAVVKAKLQALAAQGPALRAVAAAFEGYVRSAYANSPDVLADFGLAPKKARAPLTAEQQAAATAKRNATREARGTRGKKQKLLVKGNVTGVNITPVTTPPAAPAPAQASTSTTK